MKCEFCGKEFSKKILNLHKKRCSKQNIKNINKENADKKKVK